MVKDNRNLILEDTEKQILLHDLMDMGELLLSSGAEISRVEDTLTRIGTAYGAVRMNVFAITSFLVVTMVFPDRSQVTESRRILQPDQTNFMRMEELNALSRACCAHPLQLTPKDEFAARIQTIGMKPENRIRTILGSILGAGGFAVFFGGSILDGFVASIFSFLICEMQKYLGRIFPNRVIFNFIAALLTGTGIALVSQCFRFLHMDKIMIGDIMLLIPGIALTNSIRNMLVGDTISGAMRLIESILWAAALGLGFFTAILVVGRWNGGLI